MKPPRFLSDRLRQETIDELRHKLDTAYEAHSDCVDNGDDETATEWDGTIAALEHVLAIPTIRTLSLHRLAMEELDNSILLDMPSNERRMIIRDLCRAGWFPEKASPGTVWLGTPPATVQVDGKHYEVGSYE